MLAWLTVIVLSVGGPPGTPNHRFPEATIRVRALHHIGVVASGRGRIHAQVVRWRRYRVVASMLPPVSTPGRVCEERTVGVNGPTTLTLYCDIK
jgi:hypothetical protein